MAKWSRSRPSLPPLNCKTTMSKNTCFSRQTRFWPNAVRPSVSANNKVASLNFQIQHFPFPKKLWSLLMYLLMYQMMVHSTFLADPSFRGLRRVCHSEFVCSRVFEWMNDLDSIQGPVLSSSSFNLVKLWNPVTFGLGHLPHFWGPKWQWQGPQLLKKRSNTNDLFPKHHTTSPPPPRLISKHPCNISPSLSRDLQTM